MANVDPKEIKNTNAITLLSIKLKVCFILLIIVFEESSWLRHGFLMKQFVELIKKTPNCIIKMKSLISSPWSYLVFDMGRISARVICSGFT